jgi:hypothetical protein
MPAGLQRGLKRGDAANLDILSVVQPTKSLKLHSGYIRKIHQILLEHMLVSSAKNNIIIFKLIN